MHACGPHTARSQESVGHRERCWWQWRNRKLQDHQLVHSAGTPRDGKQLNARVELLNAPNNPKQTFEVFTNNGELNSLCVCFNIIDAGNTVRIVNLAPVEFPCYIHLNEI